MAVGIPQEIPETKKEKFGKLTLPKCGDSLLIDNGKGQPLTADSSVLHLTATGFEAEECQKAEITLRLVKEGKIIWKKTEIDSSCSVSHKPGGSYIISLAKPADLPSLENSELELCFDLINKEGGRASQNKPSKCSLLAIYPFLCQKIPNPNAWQ